MPWVTEQHASCADKGPKGGRSEDASDSPSERVPNVVLMLDCMYCTNCTAC